MQSGQSIPKIIEPPNYWGRFPPFSDNGQRRRRDAPAGTARTPACSDMLFCDVQATVCIQRVRLFCQSDVCRHALTAHSTSTASAKAAAAPPPSGDAARNPGPLPVPTPLQCTPRICGKYVKQVNGPTWMLKCTSPATEAGAWVGLGPADRDIRKPQLPDHGCGRECGQPAPPQQPPQAANEKWDEDTMPPSPWDRRTWPDKSRTKPGCSRRATITEIARWPPPARPEPRGWPGKPGLKAPTAGPFPSTRPTETSELSSGRQSTARPHPKVPVEPEKPKVQAESRLSHGPCGPAANSPTTATQTGASLAPAWPGARERKATTARSGESRGGGRQPATPGYSISVPPAGRAARVASRRSRDGERSPRGLHPQRQHAEQPARDIPSVPSPTPPIPPVTDGWQRAPPARASVPRQTRPVIRCKTRSKPTTVAACNSTFVRWWPPAAS